MPDQLNEHAKVQIVIQSDGQVRQYQFPAAFNPTFTVTPEVSHEKARYSLSLTATPDDDGYVCYAGEDDGEVGHIEQ